MSATQDDASIAAPAAASAAPHPESAPAPASLAAPASLPAAAPGSAAAPPVSAPAPRSEPVGVPAPMLSRAARRSGGLSARVLSLASLTTALVAIGVVLQTAAQSPGPAPVVAATAAAWQATAALSDGLRALRPGASRNPSRVRAKRAATVVADAQKRVEALHLATADTPLRSRVLRTLRADADWIDAVGSTLSNPRSPRRGDLSGLAKRAANGAALVAVDVRGAKGSVGGTGRLLSATKSP